VAETPTSVKVAVVVDLSDVIHDPSDTKWVTWTGSQREHMKGFFGQTLCGRSPVWHAGPNDSMKESDGTKPKCGRCKIVHASMIERLKNEK
jgi:hypothetical protein